MGLSRVHPWYPRIVGCAGPRAEGAADAAAVPTVLTDARDLVAIGELAEAERAAARNGATPAQARGLMAVGRARRTEDRIALWRSDQQPPTS